MGGRLRAGRILFGARQRESPPSSPSCPPHRPSSHLKPALGHSVHVPPHGAGGCGCGRGRALQCAECKARRPGAGPRVPGAGGSRRAEGWGSLPGRETSRLRLGLLRLPAAPVAATKARRLLFFRLNLNFNPKQKHSPPASNAAPHWAEPRSTRGGGRGEDRAAAAAARDHPSPIPSAATTAAWELAERDRGGGCTAQLSPRRQPSQGEAGKCQSVCVYLYG